MAVEIMIFYKKIHETAQTKGEERFNANFVDKSARLLGSCAKGLVNYELSIKENISNI